MKEVLITGSRGFLGSSMKELVEDIGYKVIPGDREGNVLKPVEFIFDFAGYGNYHYQKDIREMYNTNVRRLLQLLANSQRYDYKALIVTGSSSEYGRHDIPLHEDLLPKPETFYGSSKLMATNIAQAWAKQFDKPIAIIRPFSVTGPGEQEQHLIPTLIRSCLRGEEMKFVGNPVHDFIDIRDFTNAVMMVARQADKLKGQVINIGSGKQYSNEKVKQMVEEITGKKANVIAGEPRPYDHKMWVADNFRLKSLGWEQEYTLMDSIIDMIDKYE